MRGAKAGPGFLGLGEISAEFEAFSKQAETFSTSVKSTNAVAVPPMWKGWTQTRIFSAFVNGSAYVTDGIHLIQVKGLELTFPGYMPADDHSDSPVEYEGVRTPMSQAVRRAGSGSSYGASVAWMR